MQRKLLQLYVLSIINLTFYKKTLHSANCHSCWRRRRGYQACVPSCSLLAVMALLSCSAVPPMVSGWRSFSCKVPSSRQSRARYGRRLREHHHDLVELRLHLHLHLASPSSQSRCSLIDHLSSPWGRGGCCFFLFLPFYFSREY